MFECVSVLCHAMLLVFSIIDYRYQKISCRALFNQVSIFYFGNQVVTSVLEVAIPLSLLGERMKSVNFFLLGYLIAAFIQNYYSLPGCMSETYLTLMYWYVMPIFYFALAFVVLIVVLLLYLAWQTYKKNQIKAEIQDFFKQGTSDPHTILQFYTKYQQQMKGIGVTPGELLNFKYNIAKEYAQVENKFETTECNICYQSYTPEMLVVAFPKCKHLFDFDCLQTWLVKNPTCPFCKADFRIPFAEELVEKSKTTLLIAISKEQIVEYEKSLVAEQPGLRGPIEAAMDQAMNLGFLQPEGAQVNPIVPEQVEGQDRQVQPNQLREPLLGEEERPPGVQPQPAPRIAAAP